MRFLFVDCVTACGGTRIGGVRTFAADEPLRYGVPANADGGGAQVAPGAVSEAIGQLASWLCLERNDFTARPVFLFADRINMHGPVAAGSAVTLDAEIHQFDAESFRFSGTARVDGRLVQEIVNCSGYFMPLAELEDPAATRARFQALQRPGGAPAGGGGEAYPFAALAGTTVSLEPGVAVVTRRTLAATEPFYADHFPRFPVTPIIMLNEMIGAATARLFGLEGTGRLAVRVTEGIKIRAFVRPGDTCEVAVRTTSTSEGPAGSAGRRVATTAEILKDGKRILRGAYEYEVTG